MPTPIVTAPIDTQIRAGEFLYAPVDALTQIWAGVLVALDQATGFLVYATDAAGLSVLGRAEYDVNNTGDSTGGALSARVGRGVFKYQNSSRSAGDYALAAANIGQLCYVENEQTVQTISGSSHKVVAGVFLGLDTDGGAWVDTRIALYESAESLAYTQTQDSITDNSGGTAPMPIAGVLTIAAIAAASTDTSAAQKVATANAIAGLIAELNKVKADVAALKALL